MNIILTLIQKPLLWLLEIPPSDKWPRLEGLIRYFVSLEYDSRRPDTYVYYKVFIINFWMNIFFLGIYFISFQFHQDIDVGFIKIFYSPLTPVDTLVKGYPYNVFPILMAVTIIFSTLMFCFKTDIYTKSSVMSDRLPVGTRVKPEAYKKIHYFL